MSYVLQPRGFSNPATEDLDMAGNNVSNAGTLTASVGDMSNVTVATQLSTDVGSLVGLYGVSPTAQHPPIADLGAADPEAITINQILGALRLLGVISS